MSIENIMSESIEIPILGSSNMDICLQRGIFYFKLNQEDETIIEEAFQAARCYFSKPIEDKLLDLKTPDGLGYHGSTDKCAKESVSYRRVPVMTQLKAYASALLKRIMDHLELDSSQYQNTLETLHIVHYPASDHPSVGMAEHTDWGFITLLLTDAPGLEIQNGASFIPVPLRPGYLIVNCADMLHMLCPERVCSIMHRVTCQQEKYSLAYFYDPPLDATIMGITYEDYLTSKLQGPTDTS